MFPVPGIRLGSAAAGIKRPGRDDILIIEAAAGSTCAAVFTRNAFCAAPVAVAKDHLRSSPRWLLINSGNANAGTGQKGHEDALLTCSALGGLVGAEAERILPFSTGVIGEFLPVDRLNAALPQALEALSEAGWESAAKAIMTTDTRPKIASRQFMVGQQSVTVTGIAKGAGMIHPNMATMLAFLATDAGVSRDDLQAVLKRSVDETFNCITIDGDTSTNDACVLLASGASAPLVQGSKDFMAFERAVLEVCQILSEAIVRDGEGATKFMRIRVEEASSREEALKVGRTIALSPLVKTAFFASDPNWGRILAAVGRAGVLDFDIDRVSIFLGDVEIVRGGARAPGYTEEAGARVMAEEEILVRVRLGRGEDAATVVTCDFSYDYVRINAEYRT
ncbi:MAG: bifunctional glutamate N-acetyltransferase/amino-acid acetyltransferase ArgJ [Gammaproteobacteria bacterium]|nr:bifunctional glutamate N-acetyltransferase/amino-acid acetyltransferase ArgJ [Gammaproteobacteria bacterium]